MLRVEVFGDAVAMADVATRLDAFDGVSRVSAVEATRAGHMIVSGAVRPMSADAVLAELDLLGVPDAAIALTRLEVVGQVDAAPEASLVWADVLAAAWHNARPLARYLVFMFAAGVIAGYGVLELNTILIVGAMAVSPDLLPITAIGVGIVGRNRDLTLRALATLLLGMAITAGAAAILAFAENHLDLLGAGFSLSHAANALGGLTTVNHETVIVAFIAGAVGMLALETRASAGVGVAVSVTTIPAAGYLGVAAGIGEIDRAWGALGVLGMNVAMMALGASTALVIQRRSRRRMRARHRRDAAPGSGT
jgi:uncharacterized hydrophobic protein (TIGR00271 family)